MHEHTEKYFRNLIKLTRNQIVFTIFRLIWNQKDGRLDPNQSENGKYISLCEYLAGLFREVRSERQMRAGF